MINKKSKISIAAKAIFKKQNRIHFFDKNDIIGKEINRYGFFEHLQLYFCEVLLSYIFPKNSVTAYVDIGSNIGNHAIYFSRKFDNLFLFEPNPITSGILTANIWASADANKKTEQFQIALSDSEGTAEFYARKPSIDGQLTNLGNSGLEKTFIGSQCDVITVHTQKGDDILPQKLDSKCDFVFIKVDAEGHEVQVLDGLAHTTRKFSPIFWVEIGSNEIFNSIYDKLRSLDYIAFGIEATGPSNRLARACLGFPYQLNEILCMTSRTYADVFFVPKYLINKIPSSFRK